mmetsp:Transcript_36887/g.102391  ORF Transcript_36887/g.102391 Transcript_36887/m.102391 type:complete len:206 (+) Transcript_36887:241-858(+)
MFSQAILQNSPLRLFQALEVGLRALERVEGDLPGQARGGRLVAVAVAEQACVLGVADVKLVQALPQPSVLAQLAAVKLLQADSRACKVFLHRLLRQDLDRAEEPVLVISEEAVQNVHALGEVWQLPQMLAQPRGQEDGIRVHLRGPGGLLVLALFLDFVPSFCEDVRVEEVRGFASCCLQLDVQDSVLDSHWRTRAQPGLLVTED